MNKELWEQWTQWGVYVDGFMNSATLFLLCYFVFTSAQDAGTTRRGKHLFIHTILPPSSATSIPTPSLFLFCHLSSFVLKKGGKERQFYGSKCNYQASVWASQVVHCRRCNLLATPVVLPQILCFYRPFFFLVGWIPRSKQIRLLYFREVEWFYFILALRYKFEPWKSCICMEIYFIKPNRK
jgi:hypothetical protein